MTVNVAWVHGLGEGLEDSEPLREPSAYGPTCAQDTCPTQPTNPHQALPAALAQVLSPRCPARAWV